MAKKDSGESRRLGMAACVGAFNAAVSNSILFLLARGAGHLPYIRQGNMLVREPLTLGQVVVFSVVPAFGAAALLWFLRLTVRRPDRAFYLAAAGVFVVMLGGPAFVDIDSYASRMVLVLMHFAAAGGIILALRKSGVLGKWK